MLRKFIVPGTNVVLPALTAADDTRALTLQLARLVNVAYLTRAEPSLTPTPPVNRHPNPQLIIEATAFIKTQASLVEAALTNIQPIFIAEGFYDEFVFFGFAATVITANGSKYNTLIYRGAVTTNEGVAAMNGWHNQEIVHLPTDSPVATKWGMVNQKLSDYYQGSKETHVSLAKLTQSAVQAVKIATRRQPLPWILSAHSLGQPLIQLAAIDMVLLNAIDQSEIHIVTFGGLVLGLQDFATKFTNMFSNGVLRLVNICDFMPTLQGLTPYSPQQQPPYVQIGTALTFAWQKGEMWENHSLTGVYLRMLESARNFTLINAQVVGYPVAT